MSEKLNITDTHAHLDMPEFDGDRDQVIARAKAAGVTRIITVGTDLASSRKAVLLAHQHPELRATAGFHPHEAARMTQTDIVSLEDLTHDPSIVAIGEIGLDFYRNISPRDKQMQVLQWQLDLAGKLNLPVVIHSRQAEKEMLSGLRGWLASPTAVERQPKGVIHCFSGSWETARQYLDMGFFISLGAYIGYHSSLALRDVIKKIPRDSLVVETDCPFLPPQSYRGKRNEPSYLPLTISVLSEIFDASQTIIAADTTANAIRLFGLKTNSD